MSSSAPARSLVLSGASDPLTGPAVIRRALDAGVKSIEHGHLADEAAIQLIGEKGAWLSTQPLEPGDEPLSPANAVKIAVGTDLFFDPAGPKRRTLC